MKIQLINFDGENKYDFAVAKVSRFSDYETLDNYELNIIDLRDENIWINSHGTVYKMINSLTDFVSIRTAISDTEKSAIIFFLPQNISFKTPQRNMPLKDIIEEIKYIIENNLCRLNVVVTFGRNATKIKESEIKSDFYFRHVRLAKPKAVIYSDDSEKIVSYGYENKYFTTLDIDSNEKLECYLSKVNPFDLEDEEQPDWMKGVNMFDDIEQKKL